jgi:hypothetical protein
VIDREQPVRRDGELADPFVVGGSGRADLAAHDS